ncbi:MAG: FecR family protein [Elusimicrobiota bacterium]|nr:FecR family protein [Elusimicrobiota bacterium]
MRAVWAAVLLVAAALPASAVVLTSTDGKVLFLKNGSYTWAQVSRGQVLSAGDQLKTATGATAVVGFDDGTTVTLNPSTSFTLQESNAAASELKLSVGSLKAWISKSLNRRFMVRTPTAVCSVRGTEFEVGVNPRGETSVQMFGGLLAVADRDGNEVLLKDDQSITVTAEGLGRVTEASPQGGPAGQDKAKETAKREVGLQMGKEEVQAAAAEESKLAEYKQGKALIDVFGNRVRLEEYILRPAADQFKFVVLNERDDRFDYFYYTGTFNTTLPDDLSVALRMLGGCAGAACPYFLTGYETGRSNTQDYMLERTSGGHMVDVNSNADPDDNVTAVYDRTTDTFVPVTGAFFDTLYDTYSLSFNGVLHDSWNQPGGNVQTYLAADLPSRAQVTSLKTAANSGCAPPDCTYTENGVLHDVIYASNAAGTIWEKYDNYIISDAGKVARTSDFGGITTGAQYKKTLLGWNFQTVVTASEFNGRKIDLVVEPRIFIQSGLIP